MPEIYITCHNEKFFISIFTLDMYKRYVELMAKNVKNNISSTIFYNAKIAQEMFGNKIALTEMLEIDIEELLLATDTIHFIVQEIISKEFVDLLNTQKNEQKQEASVFDEYDEENGYIEEEGKEENPWIVCSENIDYLIKIAMRVLNNSYAQCMSMDILQLLKYIHFEFETMRNNK